MERYTPREIIEQCILRWQVSKEDATIQEVTELRHCIEAAETILAEFEMEGY